MLSDDASEDSDALGDLLRSTQRHARIKSTPDTGPSSELSASGGLRPVDLLFLPAEQRRVIRWLSRKRGARLDEIRQALAEEPEQMAETLSVLKEAGYIREVLVDSQVLYSVVLKGTIHRAGRGLAKEIWDRIALGNSIFLGQVTLFQGLSQQERERIASKLEERHYERNEVILWQGTAVDHLYLIKGGMVGISRLSPQDRLPHILAYLGQGQMLGEVGLLTAQSATATITALSRVQMLLMKRQEFFDLLAKHSGVAVELARTVAQRLSDTSTRLASSTEDVRVCVLLSIDDGPVATAIGMAMALTLAHTTKGQTVYTEYPASDRLIKLFGFTRETESYGHPGGYDILISKPRPGLPANVRVTLLMDQLVNNYTNIVVGLPGTIGSDVAYILERADQVIILTPPDQRAQALVTDLCASLKAFIRPERTHLFTVVCRQTREHDAIPAPENADFDVPFLGVAPWLAVQRYDDLIQPLAKVTKGLADSLGRTDQISVYIPTTVDIDQCADTTPYVEKTLALLGQLFGGATSKQAQGVWSSDEAGLVGEVTYIVQSFVTHSDLDRHLTAVIEHAEWLKQELRQETIALEVNQKLVLI